MATGVSTVRVSGWARWLRIGNVDVGLELGVTAKSAVMDPRSTIGDPPAYVDGTD